MENKVQISTMSMLRSMAPKTKSLTTLRCLTKYGLFLIPPTRPFSGSNALYQKRV